MTICGHKREEVAGGWRRLNNEELHKVYVSPNTIRVIKARRIDGRHVARMEEVRNAKKKILAEKPEGKRDLIELGVDGRVILE
jgi:hypothetical protein